MRRARASLITGVLVATLAGCGSNAANEVVVAAGAPTKSAAPAVGPEDDDQAETNALRSDYERRLTTWLQSDEIRNLDLRKVTQVEEERDAPGGYDSLEEAVDNATIVVAGRVTRIVSVPFGIVTFFRVDRTAKGTGLPKEIVVYQRNFLYPKSNDNGSFGEPLLNVDPTRPLLAPKDRVILLLAQATVGEGDFTSSKAEIAGIEAGTPYYDIRRETGQFMSENGKVREAKGNHGSIDVDGLSEDSLMDRAEARAKKKSS